jgi:Leucine-rich repeat (LRR) protein
MPLLSLLCCLRPSVRTREPRESAVQVHASLSHTQSPPSEIRTDTDEHQCELLASSIPLLAFPRLVDAQSLRTLRLASKQTRLAVDTYAVTSLRLSPNAPSQQQSKRAPLEAGRWSTNLLSRLCGLSSPPFPTASVPTTAMEPTRLSVQEGLATAMKVWSSLLHLHLHDVTTDDLQTLSHMPSFRWLQDIEVSVKSPDFPPDDVTQDTQHDGLFQLLSGPGAKGWLPLVTRFTARSHAYSLPYLNPLSLSRRLTYLDLSSCFCISDLTPLSSCTLLEDLRLEDCPLINSLAPISICTNISHLNLSGCEGLSDLLPLGNLTHLNTLILSGCPLIKDLSSLSPCTSIQHLDLSYLRYITDISPVASPNLLKLNLRSCTSLIDLSPLSECCCNLLSINLKGCSTLQDRNLLVSCHKLARLMLVGLNQETGEMFALQLFVWEGKLN